MESTVDHWHKVAELFLEKKLTLPEIGKLMIINEAIGLVEADKEAVHIGINVIDNSELYDSLVFGLLRRQPPDVPIAYGEIAELLNLTARIVGSSINRLIKRQAVTKEDHGRLGSVFTVYEENFHRLPPWIINFTAAIVDLHNDPEFKVQTVNAVKDTRFYRGLEIFRQEIRDKFYRPKKQPES